MNTQYRKNLKAVLEASKNYIDKRIDDLQWQLGTYDLGVESDNTSALVKTMPSGTIKLNVNKVYGASKVSENLYKKTNANDNRNGFVFSITENCILSLSGAFNDTTTGDINFGYGDTISLQNKTYYLKTFLLSGSALSNYFKIAYDLLKSDDNVEYVSNAINSYSTTINNTNGTYKAIRNIRIYIKSQDLSSISGVSVNASYGIFLKEGSEPTQWEVHYDNIHNIELSGLKVEGANLISEIKQNSAYRFNFIAHLKPNTTYFFSSNKSLQAPDLKLYNTTHTTLIATLWANNYGKSTSGMLITTSIDLTENDYYVEIGINDAMVNLGNAMLNYGNTAKTYADYVQPTTLPIDLTSIEDSGGNKLFADGSIKGNENVQDIITPTYQESAWDKVDLGSFNYGNQTAYGMNEFYSATTPENVKLPATNRDVANIVCAIFDTVARADQFNYGISIETNGKIVIKTDKYGTDVTAFKTAMSGVKLQYERNTYLTSNTDLSQLKNIQGYPNGSIIAENTYNMDVESEIDYLVEEVKA